jgi:pilus assembly protein CpaB
MNARKIALIAAVACGIALIMTFGIYKHNQVTHDAAAHSGSHVWQYLAAAKNIGDGDRIGPADLMVINWTSDQPVVGAFAVTDKAKIIGRIASYPVSNGMLITDNYLAGPDSSLGLPHKIPAGFRAFSVRTSEVNDLGGFLYPGVKVDILVAIKGSDKSPSRSLSLVQNVPVLATGKQMSPDPSGKPTTVNVITILVTPDQAQKIALAQEEGSLYFSLRNGGDEEVRDEKPTLLTEISGAGTPPAQAVARRRPLSTEAPFPSAGVPVQTMIGNQVSTQFYRGNLPVSAPTPQRQDAQTNTGVQ